jgi:hypothetical protein
MLNWMLGTRRTYLEQSPPVSKVCTSSTAVSQCGDDGLLYNASTVHTIRKCCRHEVLALCLRKCLQLCTHSRCVSRQVLCTTLTPNLCYIICTPPPAASKEAATPAASKEAATPTASKEAAEWQDLVSQLRWFREALTRGGEVTLMVLQVCVWGEEGSRGGEGNRQLCRWTAPMFDQYVGELPRHQWPAPP